MKSFSSSWPFVAFFVSGASSLVFQMIWSRLLHHVFGSSSVAISSVVSVFMGGLALGAYLAGRIADRLKRPLVGYAFAELGIAVFGLCVPILLDPEGVLAALNGVLRTTFGAESLAFMVVRFLAIVPVLLVPTTLMGATLPLLARHFVHKNESEARVSARVGTLYAVNTAGAVCGVLAAGFVLLPSLGAHATNQVALGCNFLLFAVALAFGRKPLESSTRGRASPLGAQASEERDAELAELLPSNAVGRLPASSRRLAGAAFAVSGFCALLYEVVWSRALVSTIGASAYSFALILMTFLLGIAGGSALSAALLERTRKSKRVVTFSVLVVLIAASGLALAHGERVGFLALTLALTFSALAIGLYLGAGRVMTQLAFVQLFIALATLVSVLWADKISLTFAALVAPLYDSLADHVDRVLIVMFAMVSLCVLPSALGMGAMFPLVMRAVSGGGERVGREVSIVYTRNTIGSIAGAWLPGFVLMPAIGMQATLHLGIALSALLALWLARDAARQPNVSTAPGSLAGDEILEMLAARDAAIHRRALFALRAGALGLLVLLVLGAFVPRVHRALQWDLTRMTLGVFRIALAKSALDEEAWGEPDIVYYRDGLATTVSVERWGRHYSLKNNGKVEASNGDDMATQINVAAFPLLFHTKGAAGLDVAIIGVGSGVTVGAALQFPVRRVDVMELERAVVDASRFYESVNHLDYTLPRYPFVKTERLNVLNDDGRNYLASTEERYDVIISEPSNPWLTGVADLFTVDHFRIAKRRLREGGVYGQWVQLYELSPDNVKIIYRTFAEHFRYVVAFSADDLSSDTILLGSDTPLQLDLSRVAQGMRDPRVRAEMKRARVGSAYDVLGRVLFSGRDEVMRYAQLEQRLVEPTGEQSKWVAMPEASGDAPCPAATCRRRIAPLNTDDNALIELAAPRDLIGFERYKGYLATVYGKSWPYGHIAKRLRGTEDAPRAHHAALAWSLLAHGRKREASNVLDAADVLASTEGSESAEAHAAFTAARRGHAVLAGIAAEPIPVFALPAPDPTLSERSNARLIEGVSEVLAWLKRGDAPGDRARAHQAALSIPDTLVRHAGIELRYLRGYAAYRAGVFADAITDLEGVLRAEPGAAFAHPELLFFLARAQDSIQHFGQGVDYARRWLEASGAVGPEARPARPPIPPQSQVSPAPSR